MWVSITHRRSCWVRLLHFRCEVGAVRRYLIPVANVSDRCRDIRNWIIDRYCCSSCVVGGKGRRNALCDTTGAILGVAILDDWSGGVVVACVYRVRIIGRLTEAQRLEAANP